MLEKIIEALECLYNGSDCGVALIDTETTVLWCNDISVNLLEKLTAGVRLTDVMPSVFWTQAKLHVSRGRTTELIVSLRKKRYNIFIEPFSNDESTQYAICHFSRQYHSADLATSVILHDLRHPINSILAVCEDNESKKGDMIRRNCNVALGLINDLAIVASDEMNDIVHRPTPVNMNELMRDIFEECREILKDKYEVEIKLPEAPIVCCVDRSKIENAVANLIWNANRCKEKYIGLSLEIKDGKAVISVENDGDKIPPQIRDNIFDPCVKANSEGRGLGLYIARTVAEDFGGRIYCDDSERTRFSIELPIAETAEVRNNTGIRYQTNTEYLKYRLGE